MAGNSTNLYRVLENGPMKGIDIWSRMTKPFMIGGKMSTTQLKVMAKRAKYLRESQDIEYKYEVLYHWSSLRSPDNTYVKQEWSEVTEQYYDDPLISPTAKRVIHVPTKRVTEFVGWAGICHADMTE